VQRSTPPTGSSGSGNYIGNRSYRSGTQVMF
jgi:hypothetical protein